MNTNAIWKTRTPDTHNVDAWDFHDFAAFYMPIFERDGHTARMTEFRGQPCMVVESRIPESEHDPYLFYYELRHWDSDFDRPITIEDRVVVNFWGSIITKEPIKFRAGNNHVTLRTQERGKIQGFGEE